VAIKLLGLEGILIEGYVVPSQPIKIHASPNNITHWNILFITYILNSFDNFGCKLITHSM
jgi:hypothetical protein